MKRSTWLKLTFSGLLVALVVIGLITPAEAIISGGTVVNISSTGAGSPDIEISSDGLAIAVAYYKQANGEGPVFVKSATSADGWVTATQVGVGSEPKLIFKNGGPPYVVYVVWRRSGGTAIQSAQCTLAAKAAPTCTAGADVQTASADQLNFPDIAITGGGTIHVVWQNSTNASTTIIQAAHSNTPNSLSGWSSPVSVIGSGVNRNPVLAISGSNLHLAFASGNNSALTSIQYRRSTDGGANWGNNKSYTIGVVNQISNAFDSVSNPTITATGSNVYLAWDAYDAATDAFGLIYATSANSGQSGWSSPPLYVDSGGAPASSPPGSDARFSLTLSLPPQQVGLRPSLTISGTNPAIAWQQLLGSCSVLGSGTLYYYRAGSLDGNGTGDYLSNPGDNDSMIDPDLVVRSNNIHQVYMGFARTGTTLPSCPPNGDKTTYLIAYRGPFTKTTNDKGESGNRVYLPVIKKNSK